MAAAKTAKTPKGQGMSRASWLAFAFQWAYARWCWDDMTLIEELADERADMATERPDDWIDAQAEADGLVDPCEPWGVYDNAADRNRRAELASAISAAWLAHRQARGEV